LIHEIVIFSHPAKRLMGRCRSWLFLNSKANGHEISVKEPRAKICRNRKRKNSLVNREWESLMTNTITSVAMSHLNLSGAIFNFVSILLRRTAEKQAIKIGPLNVPLLLRESMTLFPPRIQIRVPQLWHRLLHQAMVVHKSELLMGGSWFSIQGLIDSMSHRQSMYNIVKCSGDQDCFAGLAPDKNMHFFLTIHSGRNQDIISLDLYVLCLTRACWKIEGYFFEDESPHAKKLSQHILDVSKKHILELLDKAVVDLRRDLLWEKYTTMESKSHNGATDDISSEILEMRSISSLVSVAELDPHLMNLLINDANDLDINWLDAFSSMVKGPVFSHYQCFHTPIDDGYSLVYLVYFIEENLFLMLELDTNARFKSGTMIGRNRKDVEGESLSEKAQNVVQMFATWSLFLDLEQYLIIIKTLFTR